MYYSGVTALIHYGGASAHLYDGGVAEDGRLVRVFWNGRWGNNTRRRIYLTHGPSGFTVEARSGGEYSRSRFFDLPDDEDLVAGLIGFLQAPDGADRNDGWREITSAYQPAP